MKYHKLDFSPKMSLYSPSITGAIVRVASPVFCAWQPSTWPVGPTSVDYQFIETLKQIFEESVLGEISNVIEDIQKSNGDLEHRGHVIAIALMCALDAIASYGYRGQSMSAFIKAHFPSDYHPFADEIYTMYRISLVHRWNLFEASLHPDNTAVNRENGTIAFGLLNFFGALVLGTEHFLNTLATDTALQSNTLGKYEKFRQTVRP